MLLNVNKIITKSRAQGPGTRFTIWVQGCSIRCPECSNKDTWGFESNANSSTSIETLVEKIKLENDIDGVTITGGEPLNQYEAVCKLCAELFGHTNIFLLSGYTFNQLKQYNLVKIMQLVDILCLGPFKKNLACSGDWRGSSNQELFYLTDKGKKQESQKRFQKDIFVDTSGRTIITGFG